MLRLPNCAEEDRRRTSVESEGDVPFGIEGLRCSMGIGVCGEGDSGLTMYRGFSLRIPADVPNLIGMTLVWSLPPFINRECKAESPCLSAPVVVVGSDVLATVSGKAKGMGANKGTVLYPVDEDDGDGRKRQEFEFNSRKV